MSEHIQIRLISLLEEAANSFEQLETIANRELLNIPAEQVEDITFAPIERDVLDEDDEPDNEMDQLLMIRYRVHRKDLDNADDSNATPEAEES